MLAFAWPTLTFLHACEWFLHSLYKEDMEDKVIVITSASYSIREVGTGDEKATAGVHGGGDQTDEGGQRDVPGGQ
ncbi:hypothetical protein QJS10_CPA16g01088 [Acorus calamus]|uniref:Uncharacterized protein n=1 Tax=Acorus calamus TaxID=4465 RepID=A0AAV9D2N7_ACOCL|nr:hypothetical protein QJS10_CPA16g01088 [Acorus calamus]